MKTAILLRVICAVPLVFAKAVGPVPLEDAAFVDTEVSTNMPPPVCTDDPHVFSLAMDFAGSPSNAVEIAFGVDADADGALAPDEARLVIGIDNPFGWNVKGTTNGAPHKCFGEDVRATFMLDENGRVGVFKLDNRVDRQTNGVVRLFGPKEKDE